MNLWSTVKRGVFALVAGGMLLACYHPYAYCHRGWVAPRYGYAGYWRCV